MRTHTEPRLTALASTLGACLLLATPGPLHADTWWIPAVAHAPGVGGSQWRSDVTLLSLCDASASVELRLHGGGEVESRRVELDGRSQHVLRDVVSQLTSGDAAGALEVVSATPIAVTSRTYDASTAQQGVLFDGVAPEEGLAAGAEAFLPGLFETASVRTNVGALNMGSSEAEVEVLLLDRTGRQLGRFTLRVPPQSSLQDNRPYLVRLGRGDIEAGSARLRVVSGDSVWAWASVIDAATGNALTVRARPARATCPTPNVADELARIEGLTFTEEETDLPGHRRFEIRFRQPSDHGRTEAGTFLQSITLLHRSFDAPVVLQTLGYGGGWKDRQAELTQLLRANQIVVEHRFFRDSVPSPRDFRLLTIEQSSADLHRVVRAFRRLYRAPWVSTGHSKGGMTAVFHRRFHPDDVDATVPYVAPISFAAPDPRYLPFLERIGPEPCRRAVEAYQRQLLLRRPAMLARLAQRPSLRFTRIGGPDAALESIALETPFVFWQYSGVDACGAVPAPTAPDDAIYLFAHERVGFETASDSFFDFFDPYFYQAHTQLGYPSVSRANLADLLTTSAPDLEAGVLPAGVTASHDPAPMRDVSSWLSASGSRFLFVYGGGDPWTAGAFDPGGALDTHTFVEPAGTHAALLSGLTEEDRRRAFSILERWTGVRPAELPSRELESLRHEARLALGGRNVTGP